VVNKFESVKKEVYFSSKYSSPFGKSFSVNTDDSKFVFWVKVSSTDEEVLIGVVYIPPEFTSYSSQEAFNDIDFNIRNQ
jgi:CTP:phosphocholine cytidylyltransferase-like protein